MRRSTRALRGALDHEVLEADMLTRLRAWSRERRARRRARLAARGSVDTRMRNRAKIHDHGPGSHP